MSYDTQDMTAPAEWTLPEAQTTPSPLPLRLLFFVTIILMNLITNDAFAVGPILLVGQGLIVLLGLATLIIGWRSSLLRLPTEAKWTLAFFAWAITGVIVAPNYEWYWQSMVTLGKTIFMYLLFVIIVRSRQDLVMMGLAYIVSAMLFYRSGVTSSVSTGEVERIAGSVGDANGFAYFGIVGAIFALIGFYHFRNKILKVLMLLSTPVLMLMVIKSGSRSGMMGIILVAFAFYWWVLRGRAKATGGSKTAATVIGLVIMGVVGAAIVLGPFWGRLAGTLGMETHGQITEKEFGVEDVRSQVMIENVMDMLRNPLLGVSYGGHSFLALNEGTIRVGIVSHNTWASAGSGCGLPGLVIWLGANFILLRRAWRLRKDPWLSATDRTIVSLCLCFLLFWWFRSNLFVHLGDKIVLPVVGGLTGYLTAVDTACKEVSTWCVPVYEEEVPE